MCLNRCILYISLFSLSLFACSSSESRDVQFLISALDLDHLDNQVILCIPINGCSGCAQESIAFAKEYFGKKDFYITLIGDDIKEAVFYQKAYFSNGEYAITLDSQEAIANKIDIQFPSYYFISKSGIEKYLINAENLRQVLSSIQAILEKDQAD
jgi:hypothetical protein